MFRKTSTQVAAVVLTLGTLASTVRAEPIHLAEAQMDQVTAGAFLLYDPANLQGVATASVDTLYGIQNSQVTLFRSNNNGTYTDQAGLLWTAAGTLYVSLSGGIAMGILSSPTSSGQLQYWDGGYNIIPYLIATTTVARTV